MATIESQNPYVAEADTAERPRAARRNEPSELEQALGPFASLKLTVVLFALSVLLVLFGTLAQVHHDVWEVVDKLYFRTWIAKVEVRAIGEFFKLFLPRETLDWSQSTLWFPFPGGKILGGLLLLNLAAAHAIRFKVAAKGSRLLGGLMLIAAGIAATAYVIYTGMDETIEGELSPEFCRGLWHALITAVAAAALAGIYWSIASYNRIRRAEWSIITAGIAVLAVCAAWLLLNPEKRLDDSGLRILWHLTKGTFAAVLLLVGCWVAFKKRAGVVVLHAGVALLMISELITAMTSVETRMSIPEGGSANYAFDIRTVELAFTTPTDDGTRHVLISRSMLQDAVGGEPITHPELPVDVRVLDFYDNAALTRVGPMAENPATAGAGEQILAVEQDSVSGVDMNAGVNLPAAYVELVDKSSGESLGVYLVSSSGQLLPQPIAGLAASSGAEPAAIELRFRRYYKDYTVTLKDFQFNRYPGTDIPKDFRSIVQLTDPTRSVDREVEIYMNNPLRYAGDTLYQAGFDPRTETTTTLQVVDNAGWMVPYVSCMLVMIGMLAHFLITLQRFLQRRAKAATSGDPGEVGGVNWTSPAVLIPILVGVIWVGYFASKARPPVASIDGMDIQAFGELPLTAGGRYKPYDTLARNTLQQLSGRQEVKVEEGEPVSPTQWLLDVLSGVDEAEEYAVFRIENLEVLDLLSLERRPGSFRYSYAEVTSQKNLVKLREQLGLVAEIKPAERSIYQAKVSELGDKLTIFNRLLSAFASPRLSGDAERIDSELRMAFSEVQRLNRSEAPLAIPPVDLSEDWMSLFEAELRGLFTQAMGADRAPPPHPAADSLTSLLEAYKKNDAEKFNRHVDELRESLGKFENEYAAYLDSQTFTDENPPDSFSLARARFEAFFTHFSPFYHGAVSYAIAFVLVALSWLTAPKVLGRSALAIVIVTFAVHTFAIIARMYITDRPIVTNLYSSAIFIGWGAVLFGLIIEAIYKLGFGTILASVLGFSTLLIAHFLSLDSDTVTVLRAVLDTNFWLATHVVCVTMGYVATFFAGGAAIVYLLGGHVANKFDPEEERVLVRVVYGILCFAILFSFVGTVLGGLWADDSWGRFWGWDPKENGALIIVLWNALILHARWGAMVGPRGLAALAVAGNMWTTWSWFGTNELGVGLHAYGGLSDGVSFERIVLVTVALSHTLLLAMFAVPRETWREAFGRKETPGAA